MSYRAFLDLLDAHGNTADGVHVANAGGVWSALTHGFGGMSDRNGALRFSPRLPGQWAGLRFRFVRNQTRVEVEMNHERCVVRVLEGAGLAVHGDDGVVELSAGEELTIEGSATPHASTS